MALSWVCHGASFLSHIEIKVLQCIVWWLLHKYPSE